MDAINVLIVEDDEVTALNLSLSLKKFNYAKIEIAQSIEEAKEKLQAQKYHLIIIDISLQESHDGIELAHYIKENYHLPFIFLTSYSDDDIIEKAKLTEPYGYIVKPFNPESLNATIQIALFKYESEKNNNLLENRFVTNDSLTKLLYDKREADKPIVKFGEGRYHYDITLNETFFDGEKIKLTKKENLFLKLLVAKLGKTITFAQAVQYVWPDSGATENSVRTLVWRLRNKLKTDVIKNASGIGYYIEA